MSRMKEKIRNKPCVYFISDGNGNCKIGVASDIYNRFQNMQVANASNLVILNLEYYDNIYDAYERERQIHGHLRPYNVRGEWFSEKEVIQYIDGNLKPKQEQETDSLCTVGFLKMYIRILERIAKGGDKKDMLEECCLMATEEAGKLGETPEELVLSIAKSVKKRK